ncbi:MAG: redoxin domain-containing protein [Candidatus Omnitrophica bacterium]|nr:redoxin domain-containing protein [Candidatus Omnitrophota bacterium]
MKLSIILIISAMVLFPDSLMAQVTESNIYPVCQSKAIDSKSELKVGDQAPDFTLLAVGGGEVSLHDYLGTKYVVISFVPAAWTPVCSVQWPEYNQFESVFRDHDAVLLGISADNIPSLYAWINDMGGIWFEALSDFWPHGAVAEKYGVLRSDGTAERSLFIIDKQGIIRYIDIHDINQKPAFADLVVELQKLED